MIVKNVLIVAVTVFITAIAAGPFVGVDTPVKAQTTPTMPMIDDILHPSKILAVTNNWSAAVNYNGNDETCRLQTVIDDQGFMLISSPLHPTIGSLVLTSRNWKLTSNQMLTTIFRFDATAPFNLIGQSDEDTVSFSLSSDVFPAFINDMDVIDSLAIGFTGSLHNEPTWRLNTKGIGAATSAMYDCLAGGQNN